MQESLEAAAKLLLNSQYMLIKSPFQNQVTKEPRVIFGAQVMPVASFQH